MAIDQCDQNDLKTAKVVELSSLLSLVKAQKKEISLVRLTNYLHFVSVSAESIAVIMNVELTVPEQPRIL